jgi:predicted nucleic acid-binding Zn ribbon protein
MVYEFECDKCGSKREVLSSVKDRPLIIPCACGWNMHFIISTPAFTIGKAGFSLGDKPDSYWDNAERERIKKQKKAQDEEREKIAYEDKNTMTKIHNTVTNYERRNDPDAIKELKKVEDAKK